ncbi:chloroplast stem-loop binding protein of 41 kDa b, chloroplastic isoform X1 [Helianthus annuus]|uniref:chloroplast stem-loop binding protein of 41 kDa b, chloroplastic isoform X1 n=1 Tax=Helianthus annuus TaxID=4232 RepID=UPI000B8F8A16|nr:chloroplast stem-loop binding protein of 41 kDa b, chloroplastic isoform X1 [Helianthus annuus]
MDYPGLKESITNKSQNFSSLCTYTALRAGVYLESDILPHREIDAVDPKSRHKGNLETEILLESKGVNYTSIRPVYIYGPLDYNPVEEWIFHRLKAGRPIPIPKSAGGFPEPEIIHYNPKEFHYGKKKAFPFQDQDFPMIGVMGGAIPIELFVMEDHVLYEFLGLARDENEEHGRLFLERFNIFFSLNNVLIFLNLLILSNLM